MEQIASKVGLAKIDIAYERMGDAGAPAVLLIMGLGVQMIQWPEAFCRALVDGGLHLVRFDNRDIGRSTHMTGAPPPDLPAALRGDLSSASYTLADMAADSAGLLDALGIEKAHIVGASMGGAIGQHMALDYPQRVLSLTSIMSTTGNIAVGQPAPGVIAELFGGPRAVTRDDVIAQAIRARRLVGSPGYPSDETEVAAVAGRAYDRGYDPVGVARQGLATIAAGNRTERLRKLTVPTLIIHGVEDRLCDVSGGRATADTIPGAKLILIEGMGHDFAPGLRSQLAKHIGDFIMSVEGR